MNRNRYPALINKLIDYIADSPAGLIGKIAAKRYGKPSNSATKNVSLLENSQIKVLIAPVNYSGQGYAWARALEEQYSTISAQNFSVHVPGGFDFDTNLLVPVSTYHNDQTWQKLQFESSLNATHFLIEAEEPPFGRLFDRSVSKQVNALIENGVSVAYLAHGTDVRLPSRHIDNFENSYFKDESIYLPRAEEIARRNIKLLQSSNLPIFVSTPDLLSDLPEATWCPVVVDTAKWSNSNKSLSAEQIKVIHAPSVAALKGTEQILPVLKSLKEQNFLDFEIIQGVASSEMPAIFSEADVYIDQFKSGSYGVAACEAMSSGCVVIGDVTQEVRDNILLLTGLDLPIIQATPKTLGEVLMGLKNVNNLQKAKRASINFVEYVHSGKYSAEVLYNNWICNIATVSNR